MPEGAEGKNDAGLFGRVWARFGEVARRLGIVHEHDVNEALDHQEAAVPRKKLGEILVEKGKMTDDHVEVVLKEQQAGAGEAGEKPAAKPKAKAPKAKPKKAPAGKGAAKKAAKKKKKTGKAAKKKPAGKSAKKPGKK